MLNFYSLIFHTHGNVIKNILLHSWPKVLVSYCCNFFLITGMSGLWNIMFFFRCQIPKFSRTSNINYVFMNKNSILFHIIFFKFLLYIFML
jgi:hypothetical protein